MRLILIRHGETAYNAQRRFTGQADVPLSWLGIQQAAALGEWLADEYVDVIVTSDLVRTRATAQAIARHHELSVQEDRDLRELAMGEWEGYTYAEVRARDAEREAQWRVDPTTCAPPGGETVAELRDRIVRALERWQMRHPDASVVWVTHGGFIGVLLCHILDIDLNRRWQFHHENASISEIRLRDFGASIVRLNETAHLRNLGMEDEALRASQSASFTP